MRAIIIWLETRPLRFLFVGLNLFALVLYCLVAVVFGYIANLDTLMFSSVDAQTYLDVTDWLYGLSATSDYVQLRPYFYPLLLGVKFLGGSPTIWLLQFLLWLTALNLTALSVFRLTERALLTVIAFLILAFNVSLIALTFHALTETLVIFLLALWVFVFVGWEHPFRSWQRVFVLVLLLSLLVVVKPLYQLHLIIFLGMMVWYNFTQSISWLKLFVTIIALFPLLIQLLIMTNLGYGPNVSGIGSGTLRAYYFSKVYMQAEQLPNLDTARQLVQEYTTGQIITYLLQHPVRTIIVFVENIFHNFVSRSPFVNNIGLLFYTSAVNLAYTIAHLIFLWFITQTCFKKDLPLTLPLVILYVFFLIIAVTSGLSFFQGDRLVIVTLPLWLPLYAYFISTKIYNQNNSTLTVA